MSTSNEAQKPVEVRDIQTGQHATTGKWVASCYSSRLGTMEQWGDTEEAATRALITFVQDVQGDIWPPVTKATD